MGSAGTVIEYQPDVGVGYYSMGTILQAGGYRSIAGEGYFSMIFTVMILVPGVFAVAGSRGAILFSTSMLA